MNPQPGEIWLADLGLAAKTRPVVIVSRQDPNPPRSLVFDVPLTTQRRNSPYEVPLPRLPFLDSESVANVQGLGSLPTVRLERKIGTGQSAGRWRFDESATTQPSATALRNAGSATDHSEARSRSRAKASTSLSCCITSVESLR